MSGLRHEQAFGLDWGMFAAMELALLRRPVPAGALPAGVELDGRGYRRPPVGPLLPVDPLDPAQWQNELPILWPQALDAWGAADTLAVVLPDQGGYLLAATKLPTGFAVRAGDQVQVMRSRLLLLAVPPHTARPFGAGIYSLSFFGAYPDSGEVFGVAAEVSLAWMRQANDCAAWAAAPAIVAGGCAA